MSDAPKTLSMFWDGHSLTTGYPEGQPKPNVSYIRADVACALAEAMVRAGSADWLRYTASETKNMAADVWEVVAEMLESGMSAEVVARMAKEAAAAIRARGE